MIRPLTLIGMMVIIIAVFSFLMIPGWRGSSLGTGILIVCLAIGGYAIASDLGNLWKDLKQQTKEKNNESEEPPHNDPS